MGKIVLGLFLGLLIGIACRYFDIPLPSPPKLIGALVVLSMTFGYIGTDYLLMYRAKTSGRVARPLTMAQYCAGPTGIPPSREQAATLSEQASANNGVMGGEAPVEGSRT